jgi:putative membrane protein
MLVTVALAAAMAAGCNRTDSKTTTGDTSAVGTSGAGVSSGDRDFVKDVTAMNDAELNLARLAGDRATDPNTKKFAQMVIDDHTAAGDKLKTVAEQNHIDAPPPSDDKAQDATKKLSDKNGLDFDKAYADQMVDDHQKLVDKLESRIDKQTLSEYKKYQTDNANGTREKTETKAVAVVPEKSDNAVTMSLNQWAADTYPVAYAHLQAAKQMKDGLKKRSTD